MQKSSNGEFINGKWGAIVKVLTTASVSTIAVLLLYAYWNTVTNHIQHNTEVLIELKKDLEVDRGFQMQLTESLKEVETSLRFHIQQQ